VRIEQSRGREAGSLGLGLSIAHTIIRAHGGDVRLSNVPGGLRAEVVLPWDVLTDLRQDDCEIVEWRRVASPAADASSAMQQDFEQADDTGGF
jgi:hypothetical protein